jgi:hypothetical protein
MIEFCLLSKTIYMTLAFIHIGKTGGTTINHHLLHSEIKNYKMYHHNKNYQDDEKYIIWLRNPINRYVSAFNHSYYGINTNVKIIKSFDLDNCLIPMRMKNSMNKEWVFTKTYDALMRKFKNANELAESLSSDDVELQRLGKELMMRQEEHLHKGIGWYLENGKFVKENLNNIIFVGTLENMREDIEQLSNVLQIKLNNELKLRENVYVDKSMKYLSPLAIKNIIDWYKDTDYAALQELLNHGLITQQIFSSYFVYNE